MGMTSTCRRHSHHEEAHGAGAAERRSARSRHSAPPGVVDVMSAPVFAKRTESSPHTGRRPGSRQQTGVASELHERHSAEDRAVLRAP
jgi:hypothetical protein